MFSSYCVPKMIKYSVIVPHYNDSATIDTLLRSIPERSDIEVIICDDNSRTDEFESLLTIANKYCHTNVIQNTRQNKGAGAARNCALDLATGEYLLFADADDYFLDQAFTIIDQHSNPSVDIIYFSPISRKAHSTSPSQRHLRYAKLVNNHNNSSDEIRYKFHVPWSKLIRHELVQENNIEFDEVLVSNDIMFSAKTGLMANAISTVTESIYCVVEGQQRLTTPSKEKKRIRLTVELSYIEYCHSQSKNIMLPSFFNLIKRHWRYLSLSNAINLVILVVNKKINITKSSSLENQPSYYS